MTDAQIWTIIGAIYAFSAFLFIAVRRIDRTFDRANQRIFGRSGDPPPDSADAGESQCPEVRRGDG